MNKFYRKERCNGTGLVGEFDCAGCPDCNDELDEDETDNDEADE